jgi:molybdopterin/thiamine biosynthesis adenylyltransferase
MSSLRPGPRKERMKSSLVRNKALRPKLPKDCCVTVIGLGGVGSIAARYAAVFLASFQENAFLTLVDGDKFEPSNASRMLFGKHGNKARVVALELLPRFRNSRLTLQAVKRYITPQNVGEMIHPGDIVILCVDNHATRKLVNDYCAKLKDICLISGGNDGVGRDSSGKVRRGTYGNVQIYVRRHGKDITPSLTAYHPEIANPADKLPTELNCTELVMSKPQILFSNLAVASAMLNTLLLYLSKATHYGELNFDIADGLMRPTIGINK